MRHVEQESLHTEKTPPRDATTPPVLPETPVRQKRQIPFFFRLWAFLWQVLHFLMRKIYRKRVPELRQMSRVECGLACLAMVLSYYGRKTSISEIRMQYSVGRDGLSALGIVRAARYYGMRVRAISLQQNDLRFVKLPAIVHWKFNHFLVVEQWTRKHVVVVDPARGRYRLTHEEFDEGFTGVVITLEPGTSFDRRATPAISPRTLRSYVLQYIRYAPATFLQLLGASLLIQLLGLTLPLVTKVVVDQIVPFRMSSVMVVLGIGMLVLFLSQTVATLMRGWLLVYLQTRIDVHMMLGFVEHLLALPFSFFQQRSTGDLLTRLSSNTVLRDILSNQLLSTLLDSTLVIFYLLILLWQSLPFGLLTLAIGLLQVLLLVVTNRPVRDMASRQLAAQGKSQGYLTEALAGIATLKGSAAEQRAFERWSNLYYDQLNISLRYSYFSSTMYTIMTALSTASPLALLWVGATQVLNGSISLGTMVALISLAAAFFSPLAAVVMSGQQLQLIGAHLERIADVTEAEPEQKGQAVQQPSQLTGHIRLEHVSFRYAPDTPEVLHDLDLTVKPGQKVAIVGPSGSGKSTLGKLLLGLYVPTEGTILYDDMPLQQLNYQEVRRQFGVVLQEATLFSGSVLSNITLNTPNIGREQVVEAAKIAAIHEDIVNMPMGYETFVSEGGSALSGGQRQRLAIARAITSKPALLLLDEATSNLDVTTEQKVAQHLQTLACTQIIIAHRLSTIREADVILVLDRGIVVERGSHDELLRRNGYYARLMRQQLDQGVIPPDEEIAHGDDDDDEELTERLKPPATISRTDDEELTERLKPRAIINRTDDEELDEELTERLKPPAIINRTDDEELTERLKPRIIINRTGDDAHTVTEHQNVTLQSIPSAHSTNSHDARQKVAMSVTPVSSTPVQVQSHPKKPDALAVIVTILLFLSVVFGAGLFYTAINHHSNTVLPALTAQHTVGPDATPTPVPSLFPHIGTLYSGTIYAIPENRTTKMVLSNIQQQQEKISGNYSGIPQNGSFTGTITTAKQIYFIVTSNTGHANISFSGEIQPGGTISGTYCSNADATSKCSDYGIWSVTPDSNP